MAESTKLGVAQVPVRATLDELDADLDKARKKIETAMERAQGMIDKKMGDLLKKSALGLLGVTTAAGAALSKLALDAMPLQGIAAAFAGITGNADAMLTTLRDATGGMVRDVELMRNYNDAAQLVNKAFADQLPEAMQYLMKISAATGDSMDYLMSSLVKGVGRVQPLILDNLKIQVSESEITARATAMYGKKKEALSKVELQTATMNVVLEKLAANTAAMPDVIGTNVQRWGQLRTMLQNTKDMAGLMLQPALAAVLSVLVPIGERIQSSVVPAMMVLNQAIVDGVARAREMWQASEGVRVRLADMAAVIAANAGPILAGLAVTITSIVIPSLLRMAATAITTAASTIAALAPVLVPALAIGAAAALAYQAWRTNFLGIQDVTRSILHSVQQIIGTALSWIQSFWHSHGATILGYVKGLWDTVYRIFNAALTVILGFVDAELKVLRGDWEGSTQALVDALKRAGEALAPVLASGLNAVFNLLDHASKILDGIGNAWVTWFRDSVFGRITESLVGFVRKFVGFLGTVSDALGLHQTAVGRAVTVVGSWLSAGAQTASDTAASWGDSFSAMIGDIRDWSKASTAGTRVTIANLRLIEEEQNRIRSGGARVNLPTLPSFDDLFGGALGGTAGGAAGGVTGLADAASGAAKAAKEKVNETVKDIASLLDSLTQNIDNILQRLSKDLPNLRTPVQRLLQILLDVAREVADFVTQGDIKTWVDWFDRELRPTLEKWLVAIAPITGLLGTANSIMEATGKYAVQTRVSVTQFLNYLRGIMLEVGKRFDIEPGLVGFIDWFDRDLRPLIERWNTSVKPIADLLGVGRTIMDALSARVPPVRASVAQFFTFLRDTMRDAGQYFAVHTDLDEFINWFDANLRPVLVRWTTVLQPLNDLFGVARSLMDATSSEVGRTRASIATLFTSLMDLMWQAGSFLYDADSGQGQWLKHLIQWFGTWVTPVLEDWHRVLAPLQPLLSLATGMAALTKDKLDSAKVSIATLFTSLMDLMWQAGSFLYDADSGQGQWLKHLITWFQEWVTPVLERWAIALQPLQSLLSLVKGLLDIVADEERDMLLSVTAMFANLQSLLENVEVALAESKGPISDILDGWGDPGDETSITGMFSRWATILKPLQDLMSTTKGLLDIVAAEEKDMLYGVDAMFANLWSLLDLVDSSLAKVRGPIDTILASWGTADDPASITGTFARWAATLKPLQDVLSTTKGLLDVVADAEKDMLYGVDAMFANLWSLIEAVQTYMAGPGRQAIDDIIATFGDPTKEGSLAYTFGKWAAALKPLQDVMSTAKGLLDLASEKVKDIKLDIGKFFSLAIDMGRQVASYAQLNAKAIDAATAEMEAQRPRLEGFHDALKPVADLVRQITDFIANAFKLAEGEVDMAFNQRLIPTIRNLRLGMNNLYNELVAMDVSFLPDLRTKVATLHDSLRDILGIIVSMVGAKEQEGVEATVLTEFAEAIKRGLMGPTNSAKAHFDAFYSFLDVTFRANVAALDFAPAIAACIRTITDKLSEVESAVYDGGYSVGEQIGQGIADGLAAMRLTVDGAAVSLAQAAIVAAKRELGIASPSAVAAREVGQPFGVGIMVGIDRAIGQLNGALSGSMNQLVAQAAAGTNVTNTRTVTLNVTQNRLDDPRSLRDMVRLMEYSY